MLVITHDPPTHPIHPPSVPMEAIMKLGLITVCDKCLMASCWQGILMCDAAKFAGIVQKTKRQLRKLNREHESYWKSDRELANRR